MRTYRFDPSTQCEGTAEQRDAGPEGVRREALNNPAAPTSCELPKRKLRGNMGR